MFPGPRAARPRSSFFRGTNCYGRRGGRFSARGESVLCRTACLSWSARASGRHRHGRMARGARASRGAASGSTSCQALERGAAAKSRSAATFLAELRRQVGYFIAQGQPHDDLQRVVRLVPDYLVWMPYDTPLAEDVEHVYQELTVPQSPFNGTPPHADRQTAARLGADRRSAARAGPHRRGIASRVRRGRRGAALRLRRQALSAENLARVPLLVILRDGLMRPQAAGQPDYVLDDARARAGRGRLRASRRRIPQSAQLDGSLS